MDLMWSWSLRGIFTTEVFPPIPIPPNPMTALGLRDLGRFGGCIGMISPFVSGSGPVVVRGRWYHCAPGFLGKRDGEKEGKERLIHSI